VKRQVENALTVTAKKFGKMELEEQRRELFNDIFAENATIDLVKRQFFQ
jgi:hypothetical protein